MKTQLIYLETYRDAIIVPRYSPSELAYLAQPLVMLTLFLGLPNNKRTSDKLTVHDVLKNMIDWDIEDEKKGKFSPLDKILAIPMFLYHLIRMIIKTILNIAKIFTEFLPGLAEEFCRIAMENAEKKSLQYYAAKIGHAFFGALRFIGRAATSPVKGVFTEADQQRKDRMYLSAMISGVIYGAAGAAILGVTVPLLAALPIGILAYKLTAISIGLGTVSAMTVGLFGLTELLIADVTADGIVKPLLKSIGNRFSSRQTEAASLPSTTLTTTTMLQVMGAQMLMELKGHLLHLLMPMIGI
jgi:hypothetical protein